VQLKTDSQGVMHVAPAVARRWRVSPDGRTLNFELSHSARWSDGRPVTAHDFVFAFRRALSLQTAAEYAFFLFPIHNAEAYWKGTVNDFAQVGVKALDAGHLQIILEKPHPFFLQLLATPIALPLRQDNLEKQGSQFTEAGKFITNGPYQLSEWVHESTMTLTPNAALNPAEKGLKIRFLMINDPNTALVMFDNHQLDYIDTLPVAEIRHLKTAPAYQEAYGEQSLYALHYFGFNTLKPPFKDVRVRRAFAMAFDRRVIPTLLQSGQTAYNGLIPPGLIGANQTIGLGLNSREARRLLSQAGYHFRAGRCVDFPKITLGFRAQYGLQREAEIAQFLWHRALGVEIRLQPMDWKAYLSQLAQPETASAPNLFRLNWFVDYPDADSLMGLFLKANGNNHTGWHHEDYDRWVEEAAKTTDPHARRALYDKAQRLILRQEAALIPLYVPLKTYLLRPGLGAISVNPLNVLELDGLLDKPQKGG
ncbi:MAG: peptide ABC transporter substrate-binding protein, partial [Vampirovibrionales bacterium]|nr:peptide ABC transporter substrate-binding protein [Vampirovibrionales bacterium]